MSMNDEKQLIEKLHRIEALHARPGSDGEKKAAASAADRIRQRIRDLAELDPPIEYRFSVTDQWSHRLLQALLRRYGISPYRYRNQRRTTVMARVSRRFVEETFWPEFTELSNVLFAHLSVVTDRIVARAISAEKHPEDVR